MNQAADGLQPAGRAFARLALLAIILLAAVSRLYDLGRTSLWSDEASSLAQARLPFWDMIAATAQDNYPPLHNIFLFVAIRLFGESEAMLRLPSALFGIANVYLLYLLGSALWDRRTGLIAAALLTVSGFAAWYSQEARMYALLALASTAYVLTVVRLLEQPGRGRAALCVVAGSAMLYSHPYGAFLWIGINAAILLGARLHAGWPKADWPRIDWWHWLLSQALTGILFLPWLVILAHRFHHLEFGFWIPFPTFARLLTMFEALAGGRPALAGSAALMLLSLFRLKPAQNGRGRPAVAPDAGWREYLLATWLLAPLLIGYLLSLVGQPILIDRYLICSLPAMMLLSARGLGRLAFSRRVYILATVVALAWNMPRFHDSILTRQRPDFRSAVAALMRDYHAGDHIILYRRYISAAFFYYFREPQADVTGLIVPDPKAMDVAGGHRLWIVDAVDSHGDGSEILDSVGPAHVQAARYDFASLRLYLFLPKQN